MQAAEGSIRLSATDLANHLACGHLTTLNLAAAKGGPSAPYWHDPHVEAMRLRGIEHERRYVEHLQAQGRTIHRLEETGDPRQAVKRTVEAMRSGAEVIVQAALADGLWHGRADVLLRIEAASDLGDWSYEIADTKLSRETKAGTLLQLCAYSEMVAAIQGRLPDRMHVVVPGRDFVPETYRTQEYLAYYRHVKTGLQLAVDTGGAASTYPEPVAHCDICRWFSVCDERRRRDDHLSLVAGISRLQRKELQGREVRTLELLGLLPLPLDWKPSRGSVEGYEKIREQARIQLSSRRSGPPEYELLAVEPERGLARLPAPSAGDIFFDLEGDPFVEPSGLEFLWGWVAYEGDQDHYAHRWAFDRSEEKTAFEGFIDMVMERWERYPDLHLFHYAPYEPSALKRLMGRYASREAEIDRMLRAGLFIDLYRVVRQSLRAGVERYSIKDFEIFFGYKRGIPLGEASGALRSIEYALEVNDATSITEEDRERVRRYNVDDCRAARLLREWLEQQRQKLINVGHAIERPPVVPGDAPEKVNEWLTKIKPVRERLLQNLDVDSTKRNAEQQAQWLLAHMLEFHRREVKSPWWEFFRLSELSEDELMDERNAIGGLRFVERVGGTDRAPIHRYTFPFQETAIRAGDTLQVSKDEKIGSVAKIHVGDGWIDIKKRQDARDKHPSAVFSQTVYPTEELEEALFRIAQWVSANSIGSEGTYRAGRDLLLRHPPRILNGGALQHPEEDALAAARRLAPLLDRTVLCIQGPPGTGKTYTAARMAVELLKQRKTVGVCALSHKVIQNLLSAIVEAAAEEGTNVVCAQKITDPLDGGHADIVQMKDNNAVRNALLGDGVNVVGGTAWLWARPDFAEAVDVLFLDEAGQFPLANALAISQGARSLVLVGDPQQLEAPLQGSHPEGTEVSALHHFLGGHKTMPPDLGLFLEKTRRLSPDICIFTSEQFYENRLLPVPGLGRQIIQGHAAIDGSGLWLAATPHHGNRNSAPEEVKRVAEIVRSLIAPGVAWTDSHGNVHPLKINDILIVAPYNAQVAELLREMPDARIGTVDKFQGQEAPIVIYSMATSSPEEAPRGMEFLYSLNRLNVATSRARCACILVANSLLFEPECRTLGQMRLANAFCRFLEIAQKL